MHEAIVMLNKIPKGRVVTYKELARVCNTSPRAIGRIMAGNTDPKGDPCYRVVSSKGDLTGYSAEGGITKKRQLLLKDGVEVLGNRVNPDNFYAFPRKS